MPDLDLLSPVSTLPGDDTRKLEDGIAVCLSGGGCRTMPSRVTLDAARRTS